MVPKLPIALHVPSYTQCTACGQSTLNRRITAEEVAVTREPYGRRHRAYVMLDDNPPDNDGNVDSGDTAPVVAQERIRGLEAQVALLQEQLEQYRQRNDGLANKRGPSFVVGGKPWWRLWG